MNFWSVCILWRTTCKLCWQMDVFIIVKLTKVISRIPKACDMDIPLISPSSSTCITTPSPITDKPSYVSINFSFFLPLGSTTSSTFCKCSPLYDKQLRIHKKYKDFFFYSSIWNWCWQSTPLSLTWHELEMTDLHFKTDLTCFVSLNRHRSISIYSVTYDQLLNTTSENESSHHALCSKEYDSVGYAFVFFFQINL